MVEIGQVWKSKKFKDCELKIVSNLDISNTYRCLLRHSKEFIEDTYLPEFYIIDNYILYL